MAAYIKQPLEEIGNGCIHKAAPGGGRKHQKPRKPPDRSVPVATPPSHENHLVVQNNHKPVQLGKEDKTPFLRDLSNISTSHESSESMRPETESVLGKRSVQDSNVGVEMGERMNLEATGSGAAGHLTGSRAAPRQQQ